MAGPHAATGNDGGIDTGREQRGGKLPAAERLRVGQRNESRANDEESHFERYRLRQHCGGVYMNPRARDLSWVFKRFVEPLRAHWRSVRRKRQRPHFSRAFHAHMKRRCPDGHPMFGVWSDYAMTTVE